MLEHNTHLSQAAQLGDLLAPHPEPVARQDSAAVAFTIIDSETRLSKSIGLNADGTLNKVGSTKLYRGTAKRVTLSGTAAQQLEQLAAASEKLTHQQAIICAPPPAGSDTWPIVPKDDLPDHPGAIARNIENFKHGAGPALLGLDFDTAEFTPELLNKLKAGPGNISAALASVCPSFANAACLIRASASSGIVVAGNNDAPTASGHHRYFIANIGTDLPERVQNLADRLMLAGYLWGKISETGAVLHRTLFDIEASKAPSRLFYEADAVLTDERLRYAKDARKPKLQPGNVLDLSAVAPLSPAERNELDQKKMELTRELEPQALAQRARWKEKRRRELIARGTSPDAVDRIVSGALEQHELAGDWIVCLDDGTSATATEIMADAARFHKKTCADPLEPDYNGGRNIAVIYSASTPPNIFSHAHGGMKYLLPVEPLDYFDDGSAAESSVEQAPEASPNPPANAAAFAAEGWPDPLDIFGDERPADLATPPPGSLPRTIERWSASESRRKGVSQAFASASALAVIAAAIGSSLRICPRLNDVGYTETACFWIAPVDDPGRGKSPIINAATAPLRALDKQRYLESKPALERWQERAKLKGKDRPPLGPPPIIRRSLVDDITSEKLVIALSENPRGLLRAPDELVGLFGSLGAYKQNATGDRSQLLRLFDAGEMMVDRVGSGTTRVDGAPMSILAGTQPEKIAKLARDLGSDGMLQRFIFVVGDGIDRGGGIDEQADVGAADDYTALVQDLAQAEYRSAEPIMLSAGAYAVLQDTAAHIRSLGHIPGGSAAWKGHVEKWGKLMPRIALIFHAVEMWEIMGAVDPSFKADVSTARKAAEFCRFLLRHSLRFYERYFDPAPEASEARAIAGYLLTRPDVATVTRKTIYDARKTLRTDTRGLLAAMAELESAGWLDIRERQADGPVSWNVNPIVHVRFSARAQWEQEDRKTKREKLKRAGEARKNWLTSDSLSGGGSK